MVSIFKDEEDYIIRCVKKVEDFFIKKKYHYEEQFSFQDYLVSFYFSKEKIHLAVKLPIIREKKDKEKGLIVVQEVKLLKKVDKDVGNLVRFMVEEKKKLLHDQSYLSSLIRDKFVNRWFLIQECPICIEFNAHTRCDKCQFPICALCLNKFMTFENSKKIAKKFCQCNRTFYVFNKIPAHSYRNNDLESDSEEENNHIEGVFYNHVNNEDDDSENEDTLDDDSEDDEAQDDDSEDNDSKDEETQDDHSKNQDTDDSEDDEDKLMVNLFLRAVQNFSPDYTVNASH